MNNRVVVTGMGVVSPLGLDVPTTWQALIAGKWLFGSSPKLKVKKKRQINTLTKKIRLTVSFECQTGTAVRLLILQRASCH